MAAIQRTFVALAAERLLAQTIAKRRDPEPIIIEVLAEKASQEGIIFHNGGAELYLVKTLPSQYLLFPLIPQEKLSTGGKGKSKEGGKRAAEPSTTPGSFLLKPGHLQEVGHQEGASGKGGTKGAGKSDWKREARKVRGKRTV